MTTPTREKQATDYPTLADKTDNPNDVNTLLVPFVEMERLLAPAPITDKEIKKAYEALANGVGRDEFLEGVRFAEAFHGIGGSKMAVQIEEGTPITGEEAYRMAAAEYEQEQIGIWVATGNGYPQFHYLSPLEQAFWVAKIATKRGGV